MREIMKDLSNNMCGAIQGLERNLQQSHRNLVRDMTTTANHAPILNTIEQYETTHPPPTQRPGADGWTAPTHDLRNDGLRPSMHDAARTNIKLRHPTPVPTEIIKLITQQ